MCLDHSVKMGNEYSRIKVVISPPLLLSQISSNQN